MVLQGKSILDVTKTLNAEGIPTTNGKKWLKTTIHTMLSNEAYTGSRGLGNQGQGRSAEPGAGGGGTPRHRLQAGLPEGQEVARVPRPEEGEPPAALPAPTCSAASPSARPAARP